MQTKPGSGWEPPQGPSSLSPVLRHRFSIFSSTARRGARPKIRVLLGRPPALQKVRQNPEQHPSFFLEEWTPSINPLVCRSGTHAVERIGGCQAGPITTGHHDLVHHLVLPIILRLRVAASRRRTPAGPQRTGETTDANKLHAVKGTHIPEVKLQARDASTGMATGKRQFK